MFITPAWAQTAGGLSDVFNSLGPILLILPIVYFLVIRPQQQKSKAYQELISKLRRGDTVVLSSGILGKVNRVRDGDPEIDVEIAKDTIVKVVRSGVAEVRVKGEPAKDSG